MSESQTKVILQGGFPFFPFKPHRVPSLTQRHLTFAVAPTAPSLAEHREDQFRLKEHPCRWEGLTLWINPMLIIRHPLNYHGRSGSSNYLPIIRSKLVCILE